MIKKIKLRKWIILIILYILSGSTYITLISNSQWIAAIGIVLMVPSIIIAMKRTISINDFFRGLLAYGFSLFVMSMGILNKESLGSYFRVSLVFLFAYFFTKEFEFDEFRKIFTNFILVISAIDVMIYAILQKMGQFSFLPIAYNGNGEGYRIGIIFNYLLSHPERNSGIYWEPGLFATMIVLAFLLELIFEDKIHLWRALILLNKCISTFSSNKAVNYCVFFVVYALLLTLFINLDTVLTTTGLAQQRVYAKLLSDNMGSSARMQAFTRNWSLFCQNPIWGMGIGKAYSAAANFSDTSTTTFMMVEFGIIGALPTAFVIKSIIGLRKDLIVSISVITIFLCILNKEPHMRIAIIWIIAFYFSKEKSNIINKEVKV